MVTTGAVVSRIKVEDVVPVKPALSVSVAVTCFEPSPLVKVTVALYALLAQAVVAGAVTPVPATTTL